MLFKNLETPMDESYPYIAYDLVRNSVFNLKSSESKIRMIYDTNFHLKPEALSSKDVPEMINRTLEAISTFSKETGYNFAISESKLKRYFKQTASLSPDEQDLIFYAFVFAM